MLALFGPRVEISYLSCQGGIRLLLAPGGFWIPPSAWHSSAVRQRSLSGAEGDNCVSCSVTTHPKCREHWEDSSFLLGSGWCVQNVFAAKALLTCELGRGGGEELRSGLFSQAGETSSG